MYSTAEHRNTSRVAGLGVWLFLSSLLLAAGGGQAGQWVASPSPVPTAGLHAAGDNCCGHVTGSGDRLLFFDTWSGTWTRHDLDTAHEVISLLAGGDLVLFVGEDVAVAFDGPDQAVHRQPLSGQVLDTSSNRASYACDGQLAVVETDAAMYVYDATRDAWSSYPSAIPYPTAHRWTGVEPDLAYWEFGKLDGTSVNVVYSLRTGTFARAEPGICGVPSYQILDHGLAGFVDDGERAVGYNAFTGAFTYHEVGESPLSYQPVERKRRRLCHLWACGWDETVPAPGVSHYHLYVYDSLTGSWTHAVHDYDRQEGVHQTSPDIGGRFISNYYVQSVSPCWYHPGIFSGATHRQVWHSPQLRGNQLRRAIGGTVAVYGAYTDDQVQWWCTGQDHPQGLSVLPDLPLPGLAAAGEDWAVFAARGPDRELMDIYFYSGRTNSVISTQTWDDAYVDPPDLDGQHAYLLRVAGDDVDFIFYSALRHELVHQRYPEGTSVPYYLSDHLVLTYTGDSGNALFDAHTGVVHHRDCAFGNDNLGGWCCVGENEETLTLHGYSALTGNWSTCPVDGDCYDKAGDRVAVSYRSDRSRYWGFSAEEGAWTELVPASGSGGYPAVGGRTILVPDDDRLYAFWPGVWSAVPGEPPPVAGRGRILDLGCRPNPFNPATRVSFRLEAPLQVRLAVYDLAGRRVATLAEGLLPAGPHQVVWDGRDTGGVPLPSGPYFVRAEDGREGQTIKLMLIK